MGGEEGGAEGGAEQLHAAQELTPDAANKGAGLWSCLSGLWKSPLDDTGDLDARSKKGKRVSNNSDSERVSWSESDPEPILKQLTIDALDPQHKWRYAGAGDFGIVWSTYLNGVPVVVKTLNKEGRASAEAKKSFHDEIKVTTCVQRKGVVKALGTGVDHYGHEFIVLEVIHHIFGDFLGYSEVRSG